MNKKHIFVVVSLSLIFTIGLSSCSSDKSDKKKKANIDFFTDDSKNGETTSTTSPYVYDQDSFSNSKFTATEQKKFYQLATIGPIDSTQPDKYLSPRWNAIIGDDRPFGIVPITELDKQKNSSLDKSSFTVVRNLALKVAESKVTGKNSYQYSNYLSSVETNTCTLFRAENAGATSLPIANDPNWAMAMVISTAKCPQGEELHATDRIDFYDYIYFNKRNGQWFPVSISQLPKS